MLAENIESIADRLADKAEAIKSLESYLGEDDLEVARLCHRVIKEELEDLKRVVGLTQIPNDPKLYNNGGAE